MSVERWTAALTDMERHLAECRRALDRGEAIPMPPERSDLGQLPPELAARAQELLATTREVEELVRARLEEMTAELRRLPRPAPPAPPESAVDVTA